MLIKHRKSNHGISWRTVVRTAELKSKITGLHNPKWLSFSREQTSVLLLRFNNSVNVLLLRQSPQWTAVDWCIWLSSKTDFKVSQELEDVQRIRSGGVILPVGGNLFSDRSIIDKKFNIAKKLLTGNYWIYCQ